MHSLFQAVERANTVPVERLGDRSFVWPFVVDHSTVGYIKVSSVLPALQAYLEEMKIDEFLIVRPEQTVTFHPSINSLAQRTASMAKVVIYWAERNVFPALSAGWRNELYPCYSERHELLFRVERAAVGYFGLRSFGCHLNGYVETSKPDGSRQIQVWIARRSRNKKTYPHHLDNMVGGGLPAGMSPQENMLKEADEEAGLTGNSVAQSIRSVGAISFLMDTDDRGVVVETDYVYDIKLDPEFQPYPKDGEVDLFLLWSPEQIQERLLEFTPESALVMVDFFIRHGLLSAENDGRYLSIVHLLRSIGVQQLPGPS